MKHWHQVTATSSCRLWFKARSEKSHRLCWLGLAYRCHRCYILPALKVQTP